MMKRKLLKTFVLAVMIAGGWSQAWGDDYNGTSPVYSPTTAKNYSSLKNAVTDFGNSSETSFEIDLYGDVTIDARIEVASAKTLNIVPKANVNITRKDLTRSTIWFLTKLNSSAAINIGSADYTLTIAGAGHADNQRLFNTIFCREQGNMTVANVIVKDIKFDTENTNKGYLYSDKNNGGTFTMSNVTVKNCVTTEEAFVKSIRDANDVIVLNNTIDFEDCTGTTFDLIRRIKVGKTEGTDKFNTNTAPLTIKWEGTGTYAMAAGLVVVVNSVGGQAKMFDLTETAFGLKHNGNTDIKASQAYTLDVKEYGASTLVLPFASPIPSGVTAYTLNYTTGKSSVKATAVNSTLAANTPVLINAAEGSYKFVNSDNSYGTASGSEAVTSGALTGVYATTDVPSGSYILWADSENPIGFYKANSNTVNAYRAYLTADGAGARLSIVFDESTGINDVTARQSDGYVYDLQGRRMANSQFSTLNSQLKKGIYVKNGKKFMVK